MYDFSKRVRTFHEDHVRLTSGEQSDMRSRRERNLKRIEDGLAELDKPKVAETINQGGYAQRTMTQPPENDADSRYDIDLGIVFEQDDAKTPRTTRDWVRQAIARKGSGFKNDPVTKKTCVRVVYSNGYQCDFPVFRRRWTEVGYRYEISSGDEWVASDPAAMNEWIKNKVALSPVSDGSYQLRRIIRYGKFYSKTHAPRRTRIDCGRAFPAASSRRRSSSSATSRSMVGTTRRSVRPFATSPSDRSTPRYTPTEFKYQTARTPTASVG